MKFRFAEGCDATKEAGRKGGLKGGGPKYAANRPRNGKIIILAKQGLKALAILDKLYDEYPTLTLGAVEQVLYRDRKKLRPENQNQNQNQKPKAN